MARHVTRKPADKDVKKKEPHEKDAKKKDPQQEKDPSKEKVLKQHKSSLDMDPVTKAKHVLKIVLPHRLRRCDPAFIGVLCGVIIYVLHLFGVIHWFTSWLPLVGDLPLIVAVTGLARLGVEYVLAMKNLSSERKAVLVTGCDAGFGLVLCKRLVATGFVLACSNLDGDGAKELRAHHSRKIRVLEMDVTSDESVDAAAFSVKRILDQSATQDHGLFGKKLRLWSVITNAGVGLLAPLEVTPMAEIENLFKINVIGVVRTVKAFLPFLRRSNGRVIVTSSLAGTLPMPNLVAYSMSKMAVKAFAIGLQRELRPFKIKCITIEPFFYRTRMMVSPEPSPAAKVAAVEDSDQRSVYAAFVEEWEQQRRTIQTNADDMESPMRAFGHALCSMRPKRCYPVMSLLLRVLVYLSSHFDLSYMDFMVAFNRSPAQTMDDLLDLEEDVFSDVPEKQTRSRPRHPKGATKSPAPGASTTESTDSPTRGQATPSTDTTTPAPAGAKEDPSKASNKKKDVEDSPGGKRYSKRTSPGKKSNLE